MPAFSLKGKQRFEKTVVQREQSNNLMMNLGQWRDNVARNFQEKRNEMGAAIQQEWSKHQKTLAHIQHKGLNADGQVRAFSHKRGNTKISAKVGAHRGKIANGDWQNSRNQLHASVLEAKLQTGGEHWDLTANLSVGELDASMNHQTIPDKLKLSDGLHNGPKGSVSGKADLVHFSGKATVGTHKDEPIGVRLRGNIDATWGAKAGMSANSKGGFGPFQVQKLDFRVRGEIDLVIDHKDPESGTRKEIAALKINKGKFDAHLNWKELGKVVPKPKKETAPQKEEE